MKHMAHQTAVEWLIEQMFKGGLIPPETHSNNILFSRAKQMEEEQHQETFKQSRQAKIFEDGMPPVWESFEEYYNKTYEK